MLPIDRKIGATPPSDARKARSGRPPRSGPAVLGSQAGSALLMAMFTTMVLMVVAMEIMYQTTVEAKVSSQGVNQLKAYYAAKSAAELGLFRIHLFRKAAAQFGEQLPDKTMLDMIWNFPFAWPPPVTDELGMVAKDQIAKSVAASLMQGQYTLTIESEGSKIDVNDLASPSKIVATSAREQILQMFQQRIESDEAFAEEHRNYDFNKLLNNITDWIDEDRDAIGGGDERSLYSSFQSEYVPPNQPFKTLGELHMVSGMTDELFAMLAPRITVYGSKGINVNYASKDVLMSLHNGIKSEIADKIIEGRQDPARGPFKNLEDFVGFIGGLGIPATAFLDGKDEKMPLAFDAEHNFRVKAVGKSGPVIREITAITYDFDTVKERLGELLKKQADKEKGAASDPNPLDDSQDKSPSPPGNRAGQPAANQTQTQKKKIQVPKERPNVVYWVET